MQDRVTIAQVATAAGVSAMTVSNVLNNKRGASKETRRLVLEVGQRLGYQANAAARSLKTGRSGLIGVLTLDLTAQYTLEIIRGIAEELAEAETELLINASYQDPVREHQRVSFLTRGLVDGMVLVAPVLGDETADVLRRSDVPCVVIDPRQVDIPFPRVTVDNYAGMRSGVEHLLQLGHERIAYIRGEDDLESSALRYQGYADALVLAGFGVDERLVAVCDFSYAGGFRTASALIGEQSPTAIVGGADLIALGATDAARAHGLDVPSQMSVVGFDDLPQASQSFPGLTTVRQPLHEMGRTAAKALLASLTGRGLVHDHIVLPTELIVRGTTASPARTVAARRRVR